MIGSGPDKKFVRESRKRLEKLVWDSYPWQIKLRVIASKALPWLIVIGWLTLWTYLILLMVTAMANVG